MRQTRWLWRMFNPDISGRIILSTLILTGSMITASPRNTVNASNVDIDNVYSSVEITDTSVTNMVTQVCWQSAKWDTF